MRWKWAGTPPHNATAMKGPVHVMLSRGFVDYVIHDKRAKDVLHWVSKTIIPDEAYFAVLNFNPHLGAPGKIISTVANFCCYAPADGNKLLNIYVFFLDKSVHFLKTTVGLSVYLS